VVLLLVLAALSAMAAASPATAATTHFSPAAQPALAAAHRAPVFVRLGGGFHFGRSRSYGYGYNSRRRHSLLHRAFKTAIWLYVLHLFFTHGGLSILLWIVLIGLVLSLVRRPRRRYTY
jgi:hypothetical protein